MALEITCDRFVPFKKPFLFYEFEKKNVTTLNGHHLKKETSFASISQKRFGLKSRGCLPMNSKIKSQTFILLKERNRTTTIDSSCNMFSGKKMTLPSMPSLHARSATSSDMKPNIDEKDIKALQQGGDSVTYIINAMLHGLDGMNEKDDVALRVAAISAITANIDKLDRSFLLALEFMIQEAERQEDEDRIWVLEIIKEEVLRQVSQKFPAQVQVLNYLISIPSKEIRNAIFCRAASGGGYYNLNPPSSSSSSSSSSSPSSSPSSPSSSSSSLTPASNSEESDANENQNERKNEENELRLSIPGTNLTEIVAQADELISKMEVSPKIKNRKLLSRLVIIREEAKSLLANGIFDVRNTERDFKNLPQSEVDFITSLMTLPPNAFLKKKIKNVIEGLDEGMEMEENEEMKSLNKYEQRKKRPLPVRPGMLLDAIDKLINGMYAQSGSGTTVRQLEWVRKEALDILYEIAYGKRHEN